MLKSDTGEPFYAGRTTFLAAMQVRVQFSPACTSRYNGAI
jgi:hypothetical protein